MRPAAIALTCLTLAVTTLLGAAIDAQEAVGTASVHPRDGTPTPVLVRRFARCRARSGERPHIQGDRRSQQSGDGGVGRAFARRSGQSRRERGQPHRLRGESSWRHRQRRVSPARWPRTDRGARHRRPPGPTERRHRQRTSAAHGLRRLRRARHRAPARDAGHRQRREPPDGGRRQSHHVRRPADRQPPRHRRTRAGLARVSVSRLPGALRPAVRAAAEPGRARPGSRALDASRTRTGWRWAGPPMAAPMSSPQTAARTTCP